MNILYRNKQVQIILQLREDKGVILSKLAHMSKTTYAHVIKSVNKLEDKGLICRKQKDGRSINIYLTEKGQKLKDLFIDVIRLSD